MQRPRSFEPFPNTSRCGFSRSDCPTEFGEARRCSIHGVAKMRKRGCSYRRDCAAFPQSRRIRHSAAIAHSRGGGRSRLGCRLVPTIRGLRQLLCLGPCSAFYRAAVVYQNIQSASFAGSRIFLARVHPQTVHCSDSFPVQSFQQFRSVSGESGPGAASFAARSIRCRFASVMQERQQAVAGQAKPREETSASIVFR